MAMPRFVLVEQNYPDRRIANIRERVFQELSSSGVAERVKKGSRVAVGVGSRGIANINTIARAVVDWWKEQGFQPFIIPVMGSHGAATAEGQADVLAHYGIHEATMGVPVVSSLDVVELGHTTEGIKVFLDKNGYDADGIFLIARVKWHTDFEGSIESGLFKMMAIGLGKFAGAQQYHTFAYRMGLEAMIRSVGAKVFGSGKILGGLAIQEGAHHETGGLTVLNSAHGPQAMVKREEELLAEVKGWAARLPAPEIDFLIVDEIGKNISGAGMDTKVINRSVNGDYNPWQGVPKVHRLYARGLSELTYHSGVGLGMADVVHDRLVKDVDWKPTYINSLTAGTPACIRTPIHFATDREAIEALSPTVGKTDLSQVTYCRIRNTMELVHAAVSESLLPTLWPEARVISDPFEIEFDPLGDLVDFQVTMDSNAEAELHSSKH
jgi:hypothetical protein